MREDELTKADSYTENGTQTVSYFKNQVQRQELGHLDPSMYMNEETEELYDVMPGHLGRIWFMLHYKTADEELRVELVKARNLRFYRDPISGQEWLDFCIKIILDHDERRSHVVSVKKKNSNLNINSVFSIQVPLTEIESHTLHFFITSVDRHKHQKPIGTANFELKLLRKHFDSASRFYKDLSEMEDSEDCIELLVALTHHPTLERITVGLFDVKKLPINEKSLVFSRISLHQGLQCTLLKTKRSSTLCHSRSFNESFCFAKITDLEHINIRITLYKQKFGINILNKPMGFIVLGSELFAKRRELEHWQEMQDRPNEQVCYWHAISPIDG